MFFFYAGGGGSRPFPVPKSPGSKTSRWPDRMPVVTGRRGLFVEEIASFDFGCRIGHCQRSQCRGKSQIIIYLQWSSQKKKRTFPENLLRTFFYVLRRAFCSQNLWGDAIGGVTPFISGQRQRWLDSIRQVYRYKYKNTSHFKRL